jgi:hypothetical protein
VALADGGDGLGVLHGDGLAAAGVVGDGEHDQRNALAATRWMSSSRAETSMLPLKGRMVSGLRASG